MVMTLLSFLLPVLTGLVICLLLSRRIGHPWVLVWMAPGTGIGLSSILFFLWSLAFYPTFQPKIYLGLEGVLFAGLLYGLWRRRSSFHWQKPVLHLRAGEWLLGLALAASLVFFGYRFLVHTAENPLGSWDAWTLWNYRARYLLLGGASFWRNVFSVDINHPDYPFLLTGFIARCWVLIGKDRAFVPMMTAGLFTLATLGVLVAALAQFRRLGTGLLAGILLTSLPIFLWTSASQYADLPMAFYILAALVLLYLHISEGRKPAALLSAGCMAGFALWTKNEGASFLLAALLALAALQLIQMANLSTGLRSVLIFVIGAAPALLLYLGFKTWLVPPTDLFENRSLGSLIQQVTDPGRYRIIGSIVWGMLGNWGFWRIPYLPSLAMFAIVAGFRRQLPGEKTGFWTLAAILALTYVQYLGIFLITPHDLGWHMSTSIGRLYNQLLPGFLLVFLLPLRSAFDTKPEEQEAVK